MSASAGKGRVSMLLKDHWYVACPSSQLPAGAPRATQIGNLDLVLFRDANGSVRALLDRCCHRGVRLSLGRVKDGHVACGYHGWEFDSEGSLKLVPSLTPNDKMPACSIPAFLAVEKDFYVWVWIAGKNERPTYEPALLGIERRNFIQHAGVWNVDIMEAVENQLDMAHPAFSHPGIYPGHRSVDGEIPPLHQFAVECRVVDGGVEAFLPPTAQSGQEPRSFNQLVSWVRYELPYRNYVHLVRQKTFAIYNWTPLADGTCRVDFMVTFDADCEHAQPGPTATFEDKELKILAQDRVLLESARLWIDKGREEFEKSVVSDFPQLLARRLHQAAMNGKLDEFHLDKARVFEMRG